MDEQSSPSHSWLDLLRLTGVYLSVCLWFVMLAFHVFGYYLCRTMYYEKKPTKKTTNPAMTPPVTILRPLKGVDRNLYENLDSTFRQSYPSFELILSVASPNDPSLEVVERLMKEYPNVDARVITGDREVGFNPKVNNLIRGYETAKNDIVWILDSGIWVDENCLRRSVELLLLPKVGLVHQLPCVVKPTTIGAKLEWSFMNGVHARMYTTLNWLSISSCIIGKSMLFRKSVLGLCGGLEPFGKYMSEDNAIGTAIWNQGFKHRQSLDLAYHPTKTPTIEDFCMRMSRWIRTRKYAVPGATAIEPVTESILCGILASWAFNVLFGINRTVFFTLHMTLWLLSDIALWSVLDPNDPAHGLGGFLNFPYDAWLLREAIALPMYLYSMAGQTVDWRGTTYRLRANGSLEECPDKKRSSQKSQNVDDSRRSGTVPVELSSAGAEGRPLIAEGGERGYGSRQSN